MSTELKVIGIVFIVLLVISVITAAVVFAKHVYANKVSETSLEQKPEEPAAEEPVAEKQEEALEEEPAEELATETTNEEIAVTDEDMVIGDLEDDEDDREIFIKSRTFAEKMLDLDVRTQEYYGDLNNVFVSYRKINPRISKKCMSYRFGRKLVAKITARGKTMKLHLALNVNDYPVTVYFQKDLSEVKAYAETPFTVKVKSDRGLKKAIELIEELAKKHGIEKKTRFNPVDGMEDLRHLVMAEAANKNENL